MSKYQFYRLGCDKFQEMVQSLLEANRRELGTLIQFGSAGADGAREATWTQPVNHPTYLRPSNCHTDIPKKWVFQVKFHDIGLRGWAGAGSAVVTDLKVELEKVAEKYNTECHHYVLITNVPLTGASRVGTRDRVTKIGADWTSKIPCVEVWDAADLSRMLDNNPEVRSAYCELILPGDVLRALYDHFKFNTERKEATFRGYLESIVDNESKARAEEAGDDDPLPLTKVFIDQTLQLDKTSIPEQYRADVESWVGEGFSGEESDLVVPEDLDIVSSAFPLLWGAQPKVMLLAGPGYGKSTITQFLVLYHAGRIIRHSCATALAKRLKLPSNWDPEKLDASCTMRFPFRVELRRYAKWRKAQADDTASVGIASYISRKLIGGPVESSLTIDDVFGLISNNPALLILDGLDEVPNKDDRDAILKDCDAFLYRCSGENVDLQIVMSSRPQGYNGEFDRFQPLRWIINDLSEKDFYQYSADWLSERVINPEDRAEAEERIKRGMASDAVQRLATTLLQATVMLTIVRKKSDIPEERHKLFEKYVDVVFQREKTKNDLISRFESELKLLHEIVGYRIHEAISRGDIGTIPESKFTDLVWNVWRLLRGDKPIPSTPNQEIQSILELATDRLVFLSGKGTSQSDIDFIIQPYREYFAAKYMANHGEADSEKAFGCLVEKGPYWQQVLRFFAAISTPQQRLSWAYSAALNSPGMAPDLVRSLPARRAVIFSLPEFDRLQYAPFGKIIAGCFPEVEWWTWLRQGWVIPIIQGLRQGEGWRLLWRGFINTQTHSYGSAAFALMVFPRIISKDFGEHQELLEFVSNCLQDEALVKNAIEETLSHELQVDLGLAKEETLFDVLQGFPYRGGLHPAMVSRIVDRLSQPLALRYLCNSHDLFVDSNTLNVWKFLGLPVEEKLLGRIESDSSVDPALVTIPLYWLQVSIQAHLPAPEEPTHSNIFEAYVFALFRSLQYPEDASLYRKAVDSMAFVQDKIAWSLRFENVLGPAPEQFKSLVDWISYRAEMRMLYEDQESKAGLCDVVSKFGCSNGETSNEWLTLLFNPSHWDRLVHENLIDSAVIAKLRQRKWAKLANLSINLLPVARFVRYFNASNIKVSIPIIKVMRIAVDLHNRGELDESQTARDALVSPGGGDATPEELHIIINSIQNPSKFPASWAKPLMEWSLNTEDVSLEIVSEFWARLMKDRNDSIWLRLRNYPNSARAQAVITGLLKLDSEPAFNLCAQLASNSEVLPEASEEVNKRVAMALFASEISSIRRAELFHCLVHNRPTINEAQLYGDYRTFCAVVNSVPSAPTKIADRITLMPQTFPKEHFSSLRTELSRLLSSREKYPPDVCAAAIDAIIQLDVADSPPISEADWQAG